MGSNEKTDPKEIDELIFSSLGIITFIFSLGGVVTIQTALNLTSPFLPKSLIGFATRQSVILEFAPTFTSIIMVGKVGSYITSSIGSMRVTEQIDALEVMGVNSVNYLIFPKFIAMLFYPFAIAISMYVGILGGWSAAVFGAMRPTSEFIAGVQQDLVIFHVIYAFIKSLVFAIVIAHSRPITAII